LVIFVLENLKKLGKAGKRMSRRAPVADEGMYLDCGVASWAARLSALYSTLYQSISGPCERLHSGLFNLDWGLRVGIIIGVSSKNQ
jgi:hypothetical protein